MTTVRRVMGAVTACGLMVALQRYSRRYLPNETSTMDSSNSSSKKMAETTTTTTTTKKKKKAKMTMSRQFPCGQSTRCLAVLVLSYGPPSSSRTSCGRTW